MYDEFDAELLKGVRRKCRKCRKYFKGFYGKICRRCRSMRGVKARLLKVQMKRLKNG